MRDLLSALHNTHNGSLSFKITISSDTFVGLLVLLLRFFGLDLVDFDAILWVREVEVHSESIAGIDIFAFGGFAENAIACAGEGLEGSLEFGVIWISSAMALGGV